MLDSLLSSCAVMERSITVVTMISCLNMEFLVTGSCYCRPSTWQDGNR